MGIRKNIVVLSATLGITGCLFPSFDDLKGGTPGAADPEANASTSRNLPDPGSSDASTTETSSSANDAASPKSMFACDETTCEFGKEMCCAHMISPWECRAIGPLNDCDAAPQCTDNADCKGEGELCCYDQDTHVSQCKKTSCSGRKELVLCNSKKPGCKDGMCTGSWFGMTYCI